MSANMSESLKIRRASILRAIQKSRSWYVKTGDANSLPRIREYAELLGEVEVQLAEALRNEKWSE